MRKPFQGVFNIIRFNWHFYVLAVAVLCLSHFTNMLLPDSLRCANSLFFWGAIIALTVSLSVSFYVYDTSNLYTLQWLKDILPHDLGTIANINAGFDETSALLQQRYPNANMLVWDFYDPAKHTEVSIRRARKAYPPYPHTKSIRTNQVPAETSEIDAIFGILSVHEIRDEAERILFFQEMSRTLKSDGKIIIVEHLRDFANFVAYTIGFFHFHSRKKWHTTFDAAGLKCVQTRPITPFITIFVLQKNGITS